MKKIAVIGLGYVGFPLAQQAQKKGFDVLGIDQDKRKIESIDNFIHPVEGTVLDKKMNVVLAKDALLSDSDVVVICVPTPVDQLKIPDLRPVTSAVELVTKTMGSNKPLVVVESTINPGVMEDIVKPQFDKVGYVIGKDYYLAHSPERINPGDPKWFVGNIPRVVGAFTKEGLDKAYSFYTSILDAPIKKMSTIRAAEATKVVENSFRDVNIAFANELAKSFEKMNIDIMEVMSGAATKPFAFMAHYPGCGVGGHCIPVDPYYLIEKAKSVGFDHKFLRAARAINNSMPEYLVNKVQDTLNYHELSVKGTTIGLLGLSYKANVGDLRESPALVVKELLEKKGATVLTCDPYIKESDYTSLSELQNETDILVLTTNHSDFSAVDFSKVKAFIDGRNMFYGNEPTNCTYTGIGRK